jgi:hypothetical protein
VHSIAKKDVARTLRLMAYSRQDLLKLTSNLSKDCLNWRPPSEPRTIRNCLRHIAYLEPWYVSRLNVDLQTKRVKNVFGLLRYNRKIVVDYLERMPRDRMRGIFSLRRIKVRHVICGQLGRFCVDLLIMKDCIPNTLKRYCRHIKGRTVYNS